MNSMLQYMPLILQQQGMNNGIQAWHTMNEMQREREKIMWSDKMSQMRHENEMWKMLQDTLRAVRSMHYDSMKKQMQFQEKIAKDMANALGKNW